MTISNDAEILIQLDLLHQTKTLQYHLVVVYYNTLAAQLKYACTPVVHGLVSTCSIIVCLGNTFEHRVGCKYVTPVNKHNSQRHNSTPSSVAYVIFKYNWGNDHWSVIQQIISSTSVANVQWSLVAP